MFRLGLAFWNCYLMIMFMRVFYMFVVTRFLDIWPWLFLLVFIFLLLLFLFPFSFNYKSTFFFTNLDVLKLLVSTFHIFLWFLAVLIPFFFSICYLFLDLLVGVWWLLTSLVDAFVQKKLFSFVLMLSCL
jgi:hypothetical protein